MAETVSVPESQSAESPQRVRTITVRPCVIRFGRLVPRDSSTTLRIDEALTVLAPTKSQNAIKNLLSAKSGMYLGVYDHDKTIFLLSTVEPNGDIGWLLKKYPDFEQMPKSIFYVEEIFIPRETVDLPTVRSGKGNQS